RLCCEQLSPSVYKNGGIPLSAAYCFTTYYFTVHYFIALPSKRLSALLGKRIALFATIFPYHPLPNTKQSFDLTGTT
ncbi:MAG: hypothetical protein ACTH24_01185, partial [Vreelandella alkaliphila]